MVVQRRGPQISGIYANTSLNFLYRCIRIAHHSLTALNGVELWTMFFHGSFWHLRARMLAPRSETWRQGDIRKAKLCKSANRFGRAKELQFSVLTDLYESQSWIDFVFIHSALSKEEISQLQQSNTSRGANRSNE